MIIATSPPDLGITFLFLTTSTVKSFLLSILAVRAILPATLDSSSLILHPLPPVILVGPPLSIKSNSLLAS